jgi:hypothetical protein
MKHVWHSVAIVFEDFLEQVSGATITFVKSLNGGRLVVGCSLIQVPQAN